MKSRIEFRVDKSVKDSALKKSIELGFDGLSDMLRFFLNSVVDVPKPSGSSDLDNIIKNLEKELKNIPNDKIFDKHKIKMHINFLNNLKEKYY